jgi:cytochrome P450
MISELPPGPVTDPTELYETLLRRCPVHRLDRFGHPVYVLARAADVQAVLRNPGKWSSRWGNNAFFAETTGLRGDAPQATAYRRMLNPIFNARRVAKLGEWASAVCHRLLDEADERGSLELFNEYARELPNELVAELFGIDRERQDEFRRWGEAFVKGVQEGDPDAARVARDLIYGYFRERMEERRAVLMRTPQDAPDDVIQVLVSAAHPDGRPCTDEEVLPMTTVLLAGGVDTTSFLIANCVRRLLEGGLWGQIVADPALVPTAVEESLRLDPPVASVFRTPVDATELGGEQLLADTKVACLLGSANRDPAVWVDPTDFRLDRDPEALRQQQLGFGLGIHFCVGAALARMEARVAIEVLAKRMPTLRLAGNVGVLPFELPFATPRGCNSLPVRW